MKQGIVIITYHNSPFLNACAESIKNYTKYPKYIVVTDAPVVCDRKGYTVIQDTADSFELGAIKKILQETDLDEFFVLQDSVYIKDTKIFDVVFETYAGKSVTIGDRYLSYLGKYRRATLQNLYIPDVRSKHDSVKYEGEFHRQYIEADKPIVLDPLFGFNDYNNQREEEKFGRLNKVFENEWMIKYKGTWHTTMIKERKYENLLRYS